MRHREQSLVDTWDPSGARFSLIRYGTDVISSNYYPKGQYKRKSIDDVVTPGFRELQKCGKFLPLNPLVVVTETWSNTPSIESWSLVGSSYGYAGEIMPYAVAAPGKTGGSNWYSEWIPSDNDALVDAVQLAAAANAVGAKWDVLTFIAEWQSTVNTVNSLGKKFNAKVLDIIRHLKRLRRRPDQIWRFFREEWLELRYGIRPIVYDIYSAADLLNRLWLEKELVSGRGYQEETTTHADSWTNPGSTSGNRDYVLTVTTLKQYRGVAYLHLDSAGGLTIDPLLTAYELVPYSFVVDKFIDIGSWLSTLLPTLLGEFAGQASSVKTTIAATCTTVNRGNSSVTGMQSTGSVAAYTCEKYVRLPGSGVPPLPGFNPRITLPFAVDLVALFVKGRSEALRLALRR